MNICQIPSALSRNALAVIAPKSDGQIILNLPCKDEASMNSVDNDDNSAAVNEDTTRFDSELVSTEDNNVEPTKAHTQEEQHLAKD